MMWKKIIAFIALLCVSVTVTAGAQEQFEWLHDRKSWLQDTDQYRSFAKAGSPATNLAVSGGVWDTTPHTQDQWVVFDLGKRYTINAIRLKTGGSEMDPKHGKLQAGRSLDGPWIDVYDFKPNKFNGWQMFGDLDGKTFQHTARFWKLVIDVNWGNPHGIALQQVRFFGAAPIQCGDEVAILSKKTQHYLLAEDTKVRASASRLDAQERDLFTVVCDDKPNGATVFYGDSVSFLNKQMRRWLRDGSHEQTNANTEAIAELGTNGKKPEGAAEEFVLFNPSDLNDRTPVVRASETGIRNQYTSFFIVKEGQTIVRSKQYGATALDTDAMFSVVVITEWKETGCSDGSREGFVNIERYPNIAGCAATWSERLSVCPAGEVGSGSGHYGCSACASGWHVCGSGGVLNTKECNNVNEGVDPGEVMRHTCYKECKAQPGVFASATVHASTSVAPPYHGSSHLCTIASNRVSNMGCGTLTVGGDSDLIGADCSLFPEMAKKVWESGEPSSVNCRGNKQCLGTPWTACAANEQIGGPGSYRGVLCCKDGVESTLKECA